VSLQLTAAKPVGEVNDTVTYQDVPVDRPRNLIVTVTKEGGVKPVSRRVFPFHQILPKDYIAVDATLSQSEGRFDLAVKRLRTDPATDLCPVLVRVAGQTDKHVFHERGEVKYFSFSVPPQATTIPWSVTVEGVTDAFRGEVSAQGPTTTSATSPGSPP
jgi:hypothetical protein